MIHALKPMTLKASQIERSPALKITAVARCRQIWERVHRSVLKYRKNASIANVQAATAFRKAMPPLVGQKNIRDFIACAAYGVASEILPPETGTTLLNAARVALRAAPTPKKPLARTHPRLPQFMLAERRELSRTKFIKNELRRSRAAQIGSKPPASA